MKKLVLSVLGTLFLTSSAFAETILLADFDDTMVKTGANEPGSFDTKRILFRIEERPNTLMQTAEEIGLPEKIEISQQDFDLIERDLGRGDFQVGNINRSFKLSDGTSIRPGYYYLRGRDSYRYFREGPKGENYLLDSYRAAKKAYKKNKKTGDWRGPIWPIAKKALSDETLAKSFHVITIRGHSQEEWNELWDEMIKDGEIKFRPATVLALSRPEYDEYRVDMQPSVAEKKVEAIEQIIRSLFRVQPDGKKDVRISPNNDGTREPLHSLVAYEDRPQTIRALHQLFQTYSRGKEVPTKFTLVHAGRDSEVQRTGRPREAVYDDYGGTRAAEPAERIGELTHRDMKNCKLSLTELGRG